MEGIHYDQNESLKNDEGIYSLSRGCKIPINTIVWVADPVKPLLYDLELFKDMILDYDSENGFYKCKNTLFTIEEIGTRIFFSYEATA